MRSRITPLLIALLACGALPATGCNAPQQQVMTPAQPTKSVPKIEIGEYGTLKRLRGADGKNFPAEEGKTLGEGYAIGYQYKESAKAKPVERFVYALGDEHSDNLEVAKEEQTADANSMKAVVKTKDGALRIAHTIAIDGKTGSIEIRRAIQPLAEWGLERLSVVKLQAGAQLSSGSLTKSSDKLDDFLSGAKTGALILPHNGDCGMSMCPPNCIAECDPPICIFVPWCHPERYKSVQAIAVIQPLNKAQDEFKRVPVGVSEQPQALSSQPFASTIYWKLSGRPESRQIKQNEITNVVVRFKNPF